MYSISLRVFEPLASIFSSQYPLPLQKKVTCYRLGNDNANRVQIDQLFTTTAHKAHLLIFIEAVTPKAGVNGQ